MDLRPVIQRYLQSGFARPGELVGYWRNSRGDVCVLILFQREPQPLFELGVFKPDIGSWAHEVNGFTLSQPELELAIKGQREIYGTDLLALPQVCEALRKRLIVLFPVDTRPKSAAQTASVAAWRASRTMLLSLDAAPFEQDFLYRPPASTSQAWQAMLQEAADNSEMQDYLAELPAAVRVWPATSRSQTQTAPLVWLRCLQCCAAQSFIVDSVDTMFADLAAETVDTGVLEPDAAMAWPIWLGVADVAGLHRVRLPWWLALTGAVTECAIGLLAPHEVGQLARHIECLLQFTNQQTGLTINAEDTRAISNLVRAAASDRRWLVGMEPGS